jgi:hypothetical protein
VGNIISVSKFAVDLISGSIINALFLSEDPNPNIPSINTQRAPVKHRISMLLLDHSLIEKVILMKQDERE